MTQLDHFYRFIGRAFTTMIIIWSLYFSIYFIVDEAQHRRAAIGIHHGNGASIVIPIIASVFTLILSGLLWDEPKRSK